ncbi:integration host factor subunit beta [Dyella caseinilytica]|uniref:Integration host factor subunit beta n=1 Tax=Dyella caseinilytica TaxID=1849581 RepID=A0ABX7H1U5_9GAMM|nr:integration host factor subunit beta [Dyella caseinilytica]QRN55842.1 integration host factor subunit beta [Dyella caseinilytica]
MQRGGGSPPRLVPRHGHWGPMTKSELIEALARRQTHLAFSDVELAVKNVIEQMSQALSTGERIEVRGFGSFALHYRPPRMGRNPKTGDAVALPGKHVPHFKPGKELRERVNMHLEQQQEG